MRSKETQNSYTPALTSGQHLFSPQLLDATGGGEGGSGGEGRKKGKQLKREGEKEGLTVPILVLNIQAIELPCFVTPLRDSWREYGLFLSAHLCFRRLLLSLTTYENRLSFLSRKSLANTLELSIRRVIWAIQSGLLGLTSLLPHKGFLVTTLIKFAAFAVN